MKEMYDTRAKQQDQVIDTLQKTMTGMAKQIETLNTMLCAFMSQTHTSANIPTQQTLDMTSIDSHNPTSTPTIATVQANTVTGPVSGKKVKTTHAVNNNDITRGTPRIGGYFTPLITAPTHTLNAESTSREPDATMDPEAAFSALTSAKPATATNTPVTGKRPRNGSDADDDTTSNASTTRQKSSRSQKGKGK